MGERTSFIFYSGFFQILAYQEYRLWLTEHTHSIRQIKKGNEIPRNLLSRVQRFWRSDQKKQWGKYGLIRWIRHFKYCCLIFHHSCINKILVINISSTNSFKSISSLWCYPYAEVYHGTLWKTSPVGASGEKWQNIITRITENPRTLTYRWRRTREAKPYCHLKLITVKIVRIDWIKPVKGHRKTDGLAVYDTGKRNPGFSLARI